MSKLSETRKIAQESQVLKWTQTQFINFMSTTSSYVGKEKSRSIFRDEKSRYRIDRRIERGGERPIDYDSMNLAHTEIISKYSLKVRYYTLDENGEYQTDADGNKKIQYMTVRSDRKLSRSQIYKKVDRKSRRGRYPEKRVGFKIVGGLRHA